MKKPFEKIWKVLKMTLGVGWKLALIVIGIGVTCAVYEEYFTPRWYNYGVLSDKVIMRTHRLGYIQLFNAETGKKISSSKFRSVSTPSSTDSLTVFRSMNNLRGYLNANTGEIVIPAQYAHAWIFSEGIGAVVGPDDSLRFIGHDGETLFDKAFDYSTAFEYVFHDGLCIVTDFTEGGPLMGMIDRSGVWIVPQIFYDITRMEGLDVYKASMRIEDGSKRSGLLGLHGNWTLPVEYQDIDFCDCDNSLYLTKDYVKKHVSADGKTIDSFVVDYVMTLDYSALGLQPVNERGETFSRTVTSSKVAKYYVNSLCGLLDLQSGLPLTVAKFSDIFMMTDDVIRCQLEGSNSEVIYNSAGKQIH